MSYSNQFSGMSYFARTYNSQNAYQDYLECEKQSKEADEILLESLASINYAREISKRARNKALKAKEEYEKMVIQEERDRKALIEIEKMKIILQTRLEIDRVGLNYYLYIDEISKNYDLSKCKFIEDSDLEEYLENYDILRFERVFFTFENEFNSLGKALYRFFKCSKFDNLFDIVDRLPNNNERMQYLLFLLSLDANQFKGKIDKDLYMDNLSKIESYLSYFNRIFELTRWTKHNFSWICKNYDLFDTEALLEPSLAIHVI